ncbi:MAG TPA: serine hydrolase [Gemmatimonadaceae bacterium]|nr:serine hydrolase [Gemmatimonadaceae bacterium]
MRSSILPGSCAALFALASPLIAQRATAPRVATIAEVKARGDSPQQPGSFTPVPGDALSHYTAGFATTLCGAAFLTGLAPADAAANVGFFTAPLQYRSEVTDTVVDHATKTVRLTLKNGVTRVARVYGSQGCIPLPPGVDSVYFTPSVVTPNLPPAATTPWPMGDLLPATPQPSDVDTVQVQKALDAAFGPPDAMTLAVVVTYKGRIIGERYSPGIGIHTPLESWSMGKSLTGTLVARLIQMGTYTLDQPAPFPEWQTPGDPRQAIRIRDIMQMSSGLRLRAPQDPGYDATLGYPEHLYLYAGAANSYQWAATRTPQWKPGQVGRYRNVDPVLASYLVRLGAEKRGENYHAFPTRALFEKLGMRDAIIYTDPYGNYLGQGAEVIAARDWARLANLYLQDGVWNGERLLPAGYVEYAKTLAPAWVADGRPVYGGGFFWVNGDGGEPMPRDAYAMLGAGGQSAWIVPSHDLVIVRIGKYRGADAGERARRTGTGLLLQAIRR